MLRGLAGERTPDRDTVLLKISMLSLVRKRAASRKGAAAAETARLEVNALYEERGEEFLHYAITLGRDEELARDALQESFMRYFAARCRGEAITAARAWIYRVMHNYLLDRMKEERCRHEYSRQPLAWAQDQDIEGECFRREFFHLIRGALTPREYDCFRLRTEGMRYQDIAATLDLTSGAVGTMVHRAVRKLRKLIPEQTKA
jgi:RNA polymerase sigma-70 factor, ECF subfamily